MNIKLKGLVQVSLLIAMEIVLSRFMSISTPIMRIGFGFVPVAICAIMFGPIWAGIAGATADFLGATLFPIGTYFPGLTLSAALVGIVFGLFLYKRKEGWLPLAGAVAINCLIISLLLNTYWLTILMGKGFMVLLPVRIVQNLIMIPIQFFVIRLLQRPVAIYAHKQAA